MRRALIFLPLAAFIATLPPFLHGCSCGHDFSFHLLSWFEAADQFRHGTLNPHWAFAPAYNAGEPRFVFYPPLSWTLGAMLTMLFPVSAVPAVYTFLVLSAAGLAMYRLASRFASPNAALLAATFYLANPYMIFNAVERTAYAELLAAVWFPLLFLAALCPCTTVIAVALPIGLLWLTNAPAAVMGCYAFALIIVIRLLLAWREARRNTAVSNPTSEIQQTESLTGLLVTACAGTLLGLALAAFYLLPAAYERRFVQIAMAVIPNMRIQDNFPFTHPGDPVHNAVLHTASMLALCLALAATLFLLVAWALRRTQIGPDPASRNLPASTILVICAALATCIVVMLTPPSLPLWNHLPELSFLQFPWRLLSLLALVPAMAAALALSRTAVRLRFAAPLCLGLSAVLAWPATALYRQFCEAADYPRAQAAAFAEHRGPTATDEYTPNNADNDLLRADDPPYWLADSPSAFAPDTLPNPAADDPAYNGPSPVAAHPEKQLAAHSVIHAARAGFLILNLRDYPSWDITLSGSKFPHPPHIPRDDGLVAFRLDHAGDYTMDISWHRTLDQRLGLLITVIAAIVLTILIFVNRRLRHRDYDSVPEATDPLFVPSQSLPHRSSTPRVN